MIHGGKRVHYDLQIRFLARSKEGKSVMGPKCDGSPALTLVPPLGITLKDYTARADTMLSCHPESYLQAAV